jgi:cbb3-type cytochrome oxidase subunit 3
MLQEFLAQSRHLLWPLLSLVLFFLVFIGVLVYVIRSVVRRREFDHVAALPLDDDAPLTGDGGTKS